MANIVRAALVQTHWTGDKESMIQLHIDYARKAASQRLPRKAPQPAGLWLCLVCLFCFSLSMGAWAADDYWVPWVTRLSTDSATINWRGTINGSGTVDYATSSYYDVHHNFDKSTSSLTTGQYQHVQLTGLEADTSYVYLAKPSDKADAFGTSPRKFRTMPASGPFTFIVISDSHAQERRFKYVADALAKEEGVLFILDGGDYAGWDDEAFWTTYFQYADKMLAKFPVFTTIGNHEYHNKGHAEGPPTAADQYHWSFDVAPGAPLNYSFDCSGIRFVVLDSPDPNIANGDDPQTSFPLAMSQASWLKEQLINNMSGTFTIHHHPIWNNGRATIDANLGPWEDLYHFYGISANFAGHAHDYQRYSVRKIPYFVVGNAGGKFSNINEYDPRAEWYQFGKTRELGYLKVTVDPLNNTATAQEIFVASVASDDAETAKVHDPPIIADVVTFPLKMKGAPDSGGDGGGGCFVATAAFGSYSHPSVRILRDFRDKVLVTDHVGQSFVDWYYQVSPPIADFIRTRETARTAVRITLLPAVGLACLCLEFGVIPTLLGILSCVGAICFVTRRFCRCRRTSRVSPPR